MQINKNQNEKNQNPQNNLKTKPKLTLYKSVRLAVYCIFLISTICINIIAGVLPSSSREIKKHLNIGDNFFGSLNLLLSVGKIVGTILFMKINTKINRKVLNVLAICFYSIIMFLFQTTNNYWIILFFIFILGILHMIINIYIPIWIEQFGLPKKKLTLMSIIQFFNPLGKILGFLINYFLNWITILTLDGVTLCIIFVVSFIIPNKYYASEILILIDNQTGEELIDNRNESPVVFYTVKEEEEKNAQSSKENSDKTMPLVEMGGGGNDDDIALNVDQYKNLEVNLWTRMKILFNNKIFFFSLIIRTILIGIQTTIFFWFNDIINTLLGYKNKKSLYLLANIMIIIVSPLGNFITRFMGNFNLLGKKNKRRSVLLIVIFYLISCFTAYLLLNQKFFGFIAFTLAYGFFTSACLPILQGICLSCVHKKLKRDALTCSHLFTLLFGTGFPPFAFGFLYDKYGDYKIFAVKFFLICCLGVGLGSLPILIFFIYKKNYLENERNNYYKNRYSKYSTSFSTFGSGGNGNEEMIVMELANSYGDENVPQIIKEKNKQLNKNNIKPIEI